MRNTKNRVPPMVLSNSPKDPMSAIVLFGENSCGKSSTLHHLIVLLCGNGKRISTVQNAFEAKFYDHVHKKYKDFDIIVRYHSKDNEIIPVYVCTDGDSWPIVEDNIRFFYHCIRKRHKVYEFDGLNFIELDDVELMNKEWPMFCISPANITQFGGSQAQRYYLDLTSEDWRRERWIRKTKCPNPGPPVPGYYKCKKIRLEDEKLALRIIDLVEQMLKETYI